MYVHLKQQQQQQQQALNPLQHTAVYVHLKLLYDKETLNPYSKP